MFLAGSGLSHPCVNIGLLQFCNCSFSPVGGIQRLSLQIHFFSQTSSDDRLTVTQ